MRTRTSREQVPVIGRLASSAGPSPALVPGAIAVAVFLVLVATEGGYLPTTWYPAGLFFLLLLVATFAGLRTVVAGPPLAVRCAVALLAAFTAWSFLSITWAGVKGDAWDGANRTLLYLIAYILFGLPPWRAWAAAGLLGSFSLGTAVIGGVTFVQAAFAESPQPFFLEGRFSEPTGYANATAALFLAAFWPALFLASRREPPPLVRGVMLATAGLLIELSAASQSRASLVATAIMLGLYFAIVPGRLRSLLFLVPVVVAALLPLQWTLGLHDAARNGEDLHDLLTHGAAAIGFSCALLFMAGMALALLDRRLSFSERTVQRVGRAVAIVGIALAVSSVGALATVDHPVRRVEEGWQSFKTNEQSDTSTRFTAGLGSARYDFWRVALNEFVASPIHGVGVDNYAVDYLRERKTEYEPLYPHSLELRLLAQTGLVGTGLFGGFLLFALAAGWRRASRLGQFERGVAATAVVTFGYWFVHGSADWFWEFPALGAPAFAWLGMAAGIGRPPPDTVAARRFPLAVRTVGVASAAAVAAVAAASLLLPWLAAREVDHASGTWRADPATAFERLDRARELNFLSDRPDLVAGAIASRLGNRPRMRRAFGSVLERNPKNWYAHLQLAVVDSVEGRQATALRRLRTARELDPLEPVIAFAIERVKTGKPLVPRVIDAMFAERGTRTR
jgi:hypothetical protein